MRLDTIIETLDFEEISGSREVEVSGVTHDSRMVEQNFIFVAIPGFSYNGLSFVKDAVKRGAKVIISSENPDRALYPESVTWIKVKDPRLSLSTIASAIYEKPTEKLKVVGITGTSGKTTTLYLTVSVLNAGGLDSGYIGTIESFDGTQVRKSKLTTPEAHDIHSMARRMLSAGMKAMVMEVSSHSLKLHRVDDVFFDIAVFTNIGRDHLDFHRDINDYVESKAILFSRLLGMGAGRGAVVNAMDPFTDKIISKYRGKVLRFSCDRSIPADITAEKIDVSLEGIKCLIQTPWGKLGIFSPLLGKHNVLNIMGACGAGLLAGVAPEMVEKGIANIQTVPGRMEVIRGREGRIIIVDYSHTPDSLRAAIDSISNLTGGGGRIVTVFGAGGDRDREKRPLMGMAAAEKSFCCVVTSDNPRSEDPLKIMDMIIEGLEKSGFKRKNVIDEKSYVAIPDRREAINFAIKNSRPGDIILIAGKGHEDYQIFKERVIHFDDKEEAVQALKNANMFIN